jgi:hypothetical protein
MTTIGFILLTHNRPAQALRLVRNLDLHFGSPPIAIHHDFDQSPMPVEQFPACVRFVRPHFQTRWGAPSLNDAVLAGVRLLYSDSTAPDWFVLLSGADYQIKPTDQIIAELKTGGFDAYLAHRKIEAPPTDRFTLFMANRYLKKASHFWWIDWRLRRRRKNFGIPMWLSKPLLPFSKSLACYAGSQWFTANRRCAQRLLELHDKGGPLREHYWRVPIADESYLHCLLCNQPDLRVSNDNKRYIDFSGGQQSPKTLGVDDLPAILASSAHFARKFEPDDPVLDRLDEIIGARSAAAPIEREIRQ